MDELDRFWFANEYRVEKNALYEDRRRRLDESSDLSESSISSVIYRSPKNDPMEGAFEGIMGVIDNPKTHGLRLFCSQ